MLTAPTRDFLKDPATVLITGASSGIGAALARSYARPGRRLILIGRDQARLDAVADKVRDASADVHSATIDVTDTNFVTDWLERVDHDTPIDLAIANAGISGGGEGGSESREQIDRIFAVNVTGMLNTVLPLLPRMRARSRGQVALMGSLAGLRGFPGAPAYCASKAAVLSYGDSLRVALKGSGVSVSVILPGFVESAMTARNPYRMPFKMTADEAAEIIRRKLAKGRGRIAFPLAMAVAARAGQILPWPIVDLLLSRAPSKPPMDEA